ncbi:MAG: hypothetical protein CMF37_15400 [Leeuwenhoekiella sp.]|jgi:hypothetical protein|nr:hypothetical protein [Leeuwenhoekiella sp.]MBH14298.1 hypothetical protein [Leeuwenhoekiella sp.]MBQ50195.1 hypothetical protein [Leeuwenhoekiella sp.]MBQ50392.1 hypothetical protein [Leeuwenhoekiella sp.]|tara:strand:- start:10 stop:411 length:402 start_codon:yes stop_codon:yes gene_type:complete
MSQKVLPTLTVDGFVKTVPQTCDYLLAYFFLSQYSQSNMYYGKISSLAYIIQEHGHDEQTMLLRIQSTLTTLFNRYFDSVEASASIDRDKDNAAQYEIITNLNVRRGNVSYSVGRQVSLINSVVQKIVELNNG